MTNAIADYHQQHKWLFTLITDPDGLRYLTPKTYAEYQQQFNEQLARMQAFLNFAGNPERQFKAVHVAGTSGKGSVTTMIAALLTACGQRTADHVSPYLQLCNEKLQIDGKMIAPSRFAQLVRDFRQLYEAWVAQGNILKYGEAWVALTFLYFAQEKIEWGVVETGMGGRYDPTNVLRSELAVITNVDMDHVHSLGPTLHDIGRHKAGIIKPDTPAITAAIKPSIIALIEEEAAVKNAPLHRLHRRDYTLHQDGTITVRAQHNTYKKIAVPLAGTYQKLNAATAITAVDALAHTHGFQLTEATIEDALAHIHYPGRFETMQQNPTVIIDGAHNPHKMASLVRSFKEIYPGKKPSVLLGMIVGKSAAGMLAEVVPLASEMWVSQPTVFGKPSQPIADIITAIHTIAPDMPCTAAPDLHAAITQWIDQAAADDILLITGSIYLIGEARERWYLSEQILSDLESD